jgi:Glycosyl hydrolase family 20, catalytic domain/Glycosyl hydrolase family 20, domain 2
MFSLQNNRIIRQLSLAIFSIFITVNAVGANSRLRLVPTPKNLKSESGAVTLKPPFKIIAKSRDKSSFVQWLENDLNQTFNWQLTANKSMANSVIEFKYQDLGHGDEAYKLTILPRKIEIIIASQKAGYLAVGRLLSILENNSTKINSDGSLTCPKLKIFDWPDMPMRGMHLQMPYAGRINNDVQFKIICQTIDTMARLGFNFVVFEIGGRFESLKSPEVTVRGQWTQSQLRKLVKYAKAHGITPYPGINCIGHLDRSPQIFVLKNSKGRRVAMNILHPEFYNKFFGVLDELSELFDNPAYFHIGTDESAPAFKRLIADSGKKGAQLYADFINKTTQYLKQKNIRPVIWHDMLVTRNQVNSREPANGKDTFAALGMIDKRVVIDYWCYGSLAEYKGLNKLVKSGFEVWISPWQFPAGVKSLMAQVKKTKIKAVLGTTWSWVYNVGPAFVLTADYAWNALAPGFSTDYDAFGVFANYFHRRKAKVYVPDSKPLVFTGGVQEPYTNLKAENSLKISGMKFPLDKITIADKANYYPFTNTRDAKKLMAQKHKSLLLVMDPENDSSGAMLSGIDTARLSNYTVLYTPGFGNKTKTNIYGNEYVFNKGKVENITINQGNSSIPRDGGVLSSHGSGNDVIRWLTSRISVGSKVKLLVAGSNLEKNTELTAELPKNTNGFIFLLIARITAFGKPVQLGKIILEYDSGKSDIVNINNDFLIRNMPTFGALSYWSTNVAKNNLIAAYEWNKSAVSRRPKKIRIIITPTGGLLGLGVLSGKCW